MKKKTKVKLPKIVMAPANVLTTPCRAVNIDANTIKLAHTMSLVCRTARGAGLAANQIGYSQRMFVYKDGGHMRTVINPILLEEEGSIVDKEGCLSIPGRVYDIERPKYVKISYLNLDSDECTKEAEGFLARCFMHELGHLQGALIWQS